MFARIRSRLTFSNTVSLLALFVALGGSGYAAVNLPKNSVGAREIKRDAVSRSEIKRSGVSGQEVKDGGLTAADFRDDSLGGSEIRDSSIGVLDLAPSSVNASRVVPGTFLGAVVLTRRTDVHLPSGPNANTPGPEIDAFESCESGETMVNGAANVVNPARSELRISRPAINASGEGGVPGTAPDLAMGAWKASARQRDNADPTGGTLRVYAICARLP